MIDRSYPTYVVCDVLLALFKKVAASWSGQIPVEYSMWARNSDVGRDHRLLATTVDNARASRPIAVRPRTCTRHSLALMISSAHHGVHLHRCVRGMPVEAVAVRQHTATVRVRPFEPIDPLEHHIEALIILKSGAKP